MKDLPAWLSAGVASLAFVSTIILAVGNRLRDRRNEKSEAYAIALAVTPDLLRLRIEIGPIRAIIDSLRPRIEGVEGITDDTLLNDALRIAKIPMPYLLERNIDRLAKLGPVAGKACLEAVSTLTHYRRNVAGMTEALAAGELVNGEYAMKQINDLLQLLADQTHDAAEQITRRYKVL